MKFNVSHSDIHNHTKKQDYQELLIRNFSFLIDRAGDDCYIGLIEINTLEELIRFIELTGGDVSVSYRPGEIPYLEIY